MSGEHEADVAVVGSGPAGWTLADHCARLGLETILVAPAPARPWTPTYGLWTAQTRHLPPGAGLVEATAVAAGGRALRRGYAILDNASVLAAYAATPVRAVADTVVAVEGGERPRLALRSGASLRCRVAVDASGPVRRRGDRVEQTAYGMVLPREAAAPLLEPGSAIFMRWDRDAAGWPTFLYAVPLPRDRVLLEETSLARRPGLALPELKHRLTARLRAAGVDPGSRTGTEHVRFALDAPAVRARGGTVPFGVAAGMMHPATGYTVGEALETAPIVAAAIAEALPRGSRAAREAALARVWSPRAHRVHRLRLWGQRTLLRLPPALVPEFFDAFFAIPEPLQDAFLRGRDDPRGTWTAMAAVFGTASNRLRGAMASAGLAAIAPRSPGARR